MQLIKQGGYRLKGVKPESGAGILVSIITIVFNGEKFLEQTIRSVLSQTYTNIEYIIIDGGSTDGSLDIIKKYDTNIAYWKSESDKGISDAFNKGVALATGEIIGIINADDWYEPTAVEQIIKNYQPNSVMHGCIQYWDTAGNKVMRAVPSEKTLLKEMSLNHPTVFISKNLYDKVGTYSLNYKYAMDYHLLLRLYKSGANFIQLNSIITNMRLGGVSTNWVQGYKEVLSAKNEIIGNKLLNKLYYFFQVFRRGTSETLGKTPLAFIKKIYGAYISSVKKQY